VDSFPVMDVLIVDDDAEFRASVGRRLVQRGCHVQEAADGLAARAATEQHQFDVALVDLVMPGMSGLELLEHLKIDQPECEAILLTGKASIETAVQAMRLGAFDYLLKPCPFDDLERRLQQAFAHRQLLKENQQLKAAMARHDAPAQIVGQSPVMRELFRLIERAGPTDKAILIQGESGTGKELVARALHLASPLADRPLVTINCAALPETLLESELFGHEQGAFTDAVATKPGLFELADEGTLFIDEIGEIPGPVQAKLLRVLEDGLLRRIGSLKQRRVHVRLLTATNRNLADAVRAGRFREDLYYRINLMLLEVPPLRQRTGDVRLLVEHFTIPDWKVAPPALEALERFTWPGNVRQLINALDRAKILADEGLIRLRDLPPEITSHEVIPRSAPDDTGDDLASIERAHIVAVLKRERGNKARAARALGVNRRSLYRLLEKYEIRPDGAASRA
jgi:DNA-binding NtrC family response regulator